MCHFTVLIPQWYSIFWWPHFWETLKNTEVKLLNFSLKAKPYSAAAPRKLLLNSGIFQLCWQGPLVFAMFSAEILVPGKHCFLCQGRSAASQTCSVRNKLITEHTYQYLLLLLRQNVKQRLRPSSACSQTIATTPGPALKTFTPCKWSYVLSEVRVGASFLLLQGRWSQAKGPNKRRSSCRGGRKLGGLPL